MSSNDRTQAVAKQDKDGVAVDVTTQELPPLPPEVLKVYSEILSDASERLLQQTAKNNEALRQASEKEMRWSFQRLHLSFVASLLGIGAVVYMVNQDIHWVAISAMAIGSFGINFFNSFRN